MAPSCWRVTPVSPKVEEGVKVNQHIYLNLFEDQLVPSVKQVLPSSRTEPRPTRLIAFKNGIRRIWLGSGRRSYGLSIWSILESKACSSNHSNVNALKKKLTICWEEISEETLRAACSQVPTG